MMKMIITVQILMIYMRSNIENTMLKLMMIAVMHLIVIMDVVTFQHLKQYQNMRNGVVKIQTVF